MKKILILLALAGMVQIATAQDDIEMTTEASEKHSVATNSFWANWFVQANGTTRGGAFAIGKWFTPGIALRTKLNFGLTSKRNTPDYIGRDTQVLLDEQVLLNLTNMLMGYQERRVWNVIPFFGAGLNRNTALNHNVIQVTYGLQSAFRLSKHLAAQLEITRNIWNGKADYPWLKEHQKQWTFEVGLTYRLGNSTWKNAPDVESIHALSQSEIDALNAQLQDAQMEIDQVRLELESKQQGSE